MHPLSLAFDKLLEGLARIILSIEHAADPQTGFYNVSTTQPYVLDYKGRKHVFLWSTAATLMLSFDDLGSITITPGVWYNISFDQGMRIFGNNTTTTTLYIKCTDEPIP